MKPEKNYLMQGDVQLISATIPKSAKKIPNKPVAYGEHSGHQHCLMGDAELFEDGETLYVSVGKEGCLLQHIHESVFKGDFATKERLPIADHNIVELTEGTYKIGIHKRFNPFAKVWEKVID